MSTDIPELQIEESDGLIELTQQSRGSLEYPDCVYLHPIHLRYLAERFGLVETSDLAAARRIATLERRLRKMQERIGHLAWYLGNCSDHEHADLDWETDYARATAEIGEEFCADLGDPLAWPAASGAHGAATDGQPLATSSASGKSGGVQDPQKRGSSKSAAERAKDYRERKRHGVTEPRDASRTERDAIVTPGVTGQLELKP